MFKSILIANRGEIAVRVMHSAQAMGIRCVAVYSDADRDSLHVALADDAYRLGPAAVAQSYLRIDKIIEAARLSGAEAIHPGYGFLAENAAFAQGCHDAGLTFIGPPAQAMRAMGLKDAAKTLMQQAGVPVVPGYHGDKQDAAFLAQAAADVGYPVLIKARAGGGGKGMRRVDLPEDFAAALTAARAEALASFGDDKVLVEKFISQPRHIEIQVFGDAHGNVVHLFERDCSLQRRHQKVIEEAPAPGMSEQLRARMGAAAVKAAKAVGYQGAGTVEFIVDGSHSLLNNIAPPLRAGEGQRQVEGDADKKEQEQGKWEEKGKGEKKGEEKEDAGKKEPKTDFRKAADALDEGGFWFMEMNTRLQVEHPVSEAITGQDLVEWQLRVAAGEPLPVQQDDLTISGHAIEARLYAEDPEKGFMPATGRLHHLHLPDDLARIDSGVRKGDEITPYYDSMLAKIIVNGRDRDQALDKLCRALDATRVAGCVTNASFLRALAGHQGFAAGRIDTGLIERDLALLSATPRPSGEIIAAAALKALDLLAPRAASDPFSRKTGWRAWSNECRPLQLLWRGEVIDVEVTICAKNQFTVATPDGICQLTCHPLAGQQLLLDFGGRTAKARLVAQGEEINVFLDGACYTFNLPDLLADVADADAADGRILAPLPGLIHRLDVAPGDQVAAGDRLVVLEAMKMLHGLTSPCDGLVGDVAVAVGEQVSEGELLMVVTVGEQVGEGGVLRVVEPLSAGKDADAGSGLDSRPEDLASRQDGQTAARPEEKRNG